MNLHTIKDITNTRIEFETKAKRTILDVFNYHCKSLYQLKEDDLIIINNKMSLPIDLSKWFDIDDNSDFTNVLTALKKITNPKGGTPVLVIKAQLIGHDNDLNLDFVFSDKFVNGKHSLVGEYQNGQKLLFTDKLYIE